MLLFQPIVSCSDGLKIDSAFAFPAVSTFLGLWDNQWLDLTVLLCILY